ncbi:MAG TPA: hypothetical protein VKB46_10410 [Pyrinomonadaceae bacterium]|nr:hypothetical protein [Pyrinomonadaceae bacterium]
MKSSRNSKRLTLNTVSNGPAGSRYLKAETLWVLVPTRHVMPSISKLSLGTFYQTLLIVGCCLATVSAQTPGQDPVQQLRQDIMAQQATLEEQNRKMDQLLLRLESLERERKTVPAMTAGPKPQPQPHQADPMNNPQAPLLVRDPIGDLNADEVSAGEIPGSIQLPTTKGVSLAIGGFIKSVAYYDTRAENRGPVFFPASLGAVRDDLNGDFALSAALTRLNFDARTKVGNARFRGHVEFDFNAASNFNLRLGYLTWDDRWGQVLAGKFWSNFMDLRAGGEALSEATVSGAVFARQAQIRYTRQLRRGVRWTVSVEDPQSNDVVAAEPILTRTAWPDFISTISVNRERSHIQLGGLVRRLTVDPNGEKNFGTTGWAAHLSSHLDLGSNRLAGTFVYGRGLGRYMLGLLSTSGGFVDLDQRSISTRNALGGTGVVRHRWNSPCRTTTGVGYATVENDPRQPDAALRATVYGFGNLLCTVRPYLTIGGEYTYGRRWNKVGALDNNRFMIGFQLF